MKTRIVQEGDDEDKIFIVLREGRRVIIETERPGIARAVERMMLASLKGDGKTALIGFAAGLED